MEKTADATAVEVGLIYTRDEVAERCRMGVGVFDLLASLFGVGVESVAAMSAGARGGGGDRGLGELGESERIGGSSVHSRPPVRFAPPSQA
eukprot:scaffold3451_cov116-Isochrysis_galbana.AAC.4